MPVSGAARAARQADILARLDRFAALHGHVNVHQQYKDPDGYPLGRVLHEIRMSRRKGTLPPDFEQALTARGIVWDPGTRTTGGRTDRDFQTKVECLRHYMAVHGHANPRQRDTCPDHPDVAVGRFLTRLRDSHRAGTLPAEHRTVLVDLGVEFDPEKVATLGAASPNRANTYRAHTDQTWAKALAVALDYFNAGGDLNLVVRNLDYPGYPRLGKHLARAHTAHANETLPADVTAQFEALGVVWATGGQRNTLHRLEARIDRALAGMAAFYAEHGHTDLYRDYRTPDGRWLYDLVTDLRRLASKDRLSDTDRARLTAAGIILPAPGQILREATTAARARPPAPALPDEHILDLTPLDET